MLEVQEIRRRRVEALIDARFDGSRSAFARAVNRAQSQISETLSGGKSFGEKLARGIETALNLPEGSLDAPIDGVRETDDAPLDYVPVRRKRLAVHAGVTGWTIEYHNEDSAPIFFRREWLQRRGLHAEQLVAVKVRGASMEPGLFDGDTVVINLSDTRPLDGECFGVNYEGELVIKRLRRDGGAWWLSSDNQDKTRYADKAVSAGAEILGRVIHKSSERI
jgi:phage repressor protein C with HTH and peptisase S24 domain